MSAAIRSYRSRQTPLKVRTGNLVWRPWFRNVGGAVNKSGMNCPLRNGHSPGARAPSRRRRRGDTTFSNPPRIAGRQTRRDATGPEARKRSAKIQVYLAAWSGAARGRSLLGSRLDECHLLRQPRPCRIQPLSSRRLSKQASVRLALRRPLRWHRLVRPRPRWLGRRIQTKQWGDHANGRRQRAL